MYAYTYVHIYIYICSLCLHAAAVSLGSKWMSRLPPEPDSEPPTESDLAEDFERLAISPAAASSSEAVTVTPAPRFVLESRRSAAEHFPSLTILESRERPTATIYQHFSINGEEAVVLLHRYFQRLYPGDHLGLHPEIRFYVVWLTPEQREGEGKLTLTGLHFGVGNRAYRGILETNQGIFSTLRFKRVPDFIEGRRTFLAEVDNFEIDRSFGNRFFIWK